MKVKELIKDIMDNYEYNFQLQERMYYEITVKLMLEEAIKRIGEVE